MEDSADKNYRLAPEITEAEIRQAVIDLDEKRSKRLLRNSHPPEWVIKIVGPSRKGPRPVAWDVIKEHLNEMGKKVGFSVGRMTLCKWFDHEGNLKNGQR